MNQCAWRGVGTGKSAILIPTKTLGYKRCSIAVYRFFVNRSTGHFDHTLRQ